MRRSILIGMEHTAVACSNGHRLDERPDLPVGERVPCPECGTLGRVHSVTGAATVTVSASMLWEHRHEYWERNRTLLVVVAIITVGSPLIGLAVAGLSGVAIGLVLGVVADYVGAKAVVRVQVVERAHAD